MFCHPQKVQEFCKKAYEETGEYPKLILLETKSAYHTSAIHYITKYATNGTDYVPFSKPVQLQGAQYSFVCKNIQTRKNFNIDNYITIGGKNHQKPLKEHLKFRVNKSFAKQCSYPKNTPGISALEAQLVPPYAIWLSDK